MNATMTRYTDTAKNVGKATAQEVLPWGVLLGRAFVRQGVVLGLGAAVGATVGAMTSATVSGTGHKQFLLFGPEVGGTSYADAAQSAVVLGGSAYNAYRTLDEAWGLAEGQYHRLVLAGAERWARFLEAREAKAALEAAKAKATEQVTSQVASPEILEEAQGLLQGVNDMLAQVGELERKATAGVVSAEAVLTKAAPSPEAAAQAKAEAKALATAELKARAEQTRKKSEFDHQAVQAALGGRA